MNTVTSWIDYWNRKVKQCTIWDVKLAQIWAAAFMLIIVKIFPQIMQLSVWWFVAIMALCAPRIFVVWFKKNDQQSNAADAVKPSR